MAFKFHTILVLCHILAVALGLGSALLADWIVLRKLAFGTVSQKAAQQLIDLSHGVCAGLALIWITGALLVTDTALNAPASLVNQKLWAKLAIVAALTLNAVLRRAGLGDAEQERREEDEARRILRDEERASRDAAHPSVNEHDAHRRALLALRREDRIGDAVLHRMLREVDLHSNAEETKAEGA